MARLPRIYIEGAIHYVTCRSAFNEKLFKEKKDYQMYLELLEKYRQEHNFKLFAYVLLPQHLHLLIEPNSETGISDIMRGLNTAYSKYFNNCYNRRGHVFRERFKATIVEKEQYLCQLTSHVHLNPVRMRSAAKAGDYSYSSYYLYKQASPKYDEIKEVLQCLGGDSYEAYTERVKEDVSNMHKRLQRGGILGSREFIKRVKEEIKNIKVTTEDTSGSNRKYIFVGMGVLLALISLAGTLTFLQYKEKTTVAPTEEPRRKPFIIAEIEDLDNTEWRVEFSPLNEAGNSFTDSLTFSKGKFSSSRFRGKGARPGNYSVTKDGSKIIWETIQSASNTAVSWRGEIEDDKMQGILSLRSPEGTQDFSFISANYRRKE